MSGVFSSRAVVALCAVLLAGAAVCAEDARPFALGEDILLQIALERNLFSVNTIDGAWGAKSSAALAAWLAANGFDAATDRATAYDLIRESEASSPAPYRLVKVTKSDFETLCSIPRNPAEKALMHTMGYETLEEKFAEMGHVSRICLKKLNPSAAWPNPRPGTVLRIPNIATTNKPPKAALVKVNLTKLNITVFDANGAMIAYFPCSIAADKAKRPPTGEIRVKGIAPNPNYTYTSETKDFRGKHRKYIYPPGPNNPVGSAWIGLSIPTYGIHGTPNPETIGRAESHGCFRLSNWNAIRLRDMVSEGCRVIVEG